jgi:hypothetical protein
VSDKEDVAGMFAGLRRRQSGAFSRAQANAHGYRTGRSRGGAGLGGSSGCIAGCMWTSRDRFLGRPGSGQPGWRTVQRPRWAARPPFAGTVSRATGEVMRSGWRYPIIDGCASSRASCSGVAVISKAGCSARGSRRSSGWKSPSSRPRAAGRRSTTRWRSCSTPVDSVVPLQSAFWMNWIPCLAVPRRELLSRVLRDARDGVESFLELTYLRRVERAHGLPVAKRQVRVARDGVTIYRDAEYEDYGLIVELDGRIGHEDASSRWRDMTRDNAAVVEAKHTLRFGYQLVGDPCAAAVQVVAVLHARGWPGSPTPCTPTCPLPVPSVPELGSAAHRK